MILRISRRAESRVDSLSLLSATSINLSRIHSGVIPFELRVFMTLAGSTKASKERVSVFRVRAVGVSDSYTSISVISLSIPYYVGLSTPVSRVC